MFWFDVVIWSSLSFYYLVSCNLYDLIFARANEWTRRNRSIYRDANQNTANKMRDNDERNQIIYGLFISINSLCIETVFVFFPSPKHISTHFPGAADGESSKKSMWCALERTKCGKKNTTWQHFGFILVMKVHTSFKKCCCFIRNLVLIPKNVYLVYSIAH